MATVLVVESPLPVLVVSGEPATAHVIDRRAERIVLHALREGLLFPGAGRSASWRSDKGEDAGWDIEFDTEDGERVSIVVKGTADDTLTSFELTANEWQAIQRLEHRYWVALVTRCLSEKPCIELLQDPAKSARDGRLLVEPATYRARRT